MDVRQLEYFVAVAEELNFTRAAARCHVVQSALSYQISRLERETRVTLFERTSRSVRLAPAGELLLPRARRVLAELDLAGAELAEFAGVLTGRLRLGMIGSASDAAPMVESALVTFHQRHPAVEITIQDSGSSNMADLVRGGVLDVAFVGLFADQVPVDVVHTVLAVEPLVVVLHRSHTLAGAGTADLAELAELTPFVEMRAESGLRRQVDATFERAGLSRRIAFELSTSDAVVRYVALGFGAAIVPLSSAARTDVAVLALADPLARHPVSLIHRQPAPSAPSARAFIALLPSDQPTKPASDRRSRAKDAARQ
jgi:DNA-binding transcriptional LysR family regulator